MKRLPRLFYKLSRLRWYLTRPITLGVRLILLREGEVLLVQHTYQSSWYLPGGGVEKGENLEQAARREAGEELGARLGDLRLFGIYTNFYDYKNDHVVVFLCDDFELAGTIDREIEAWSFFALDTLPEGLSPGSGRRLEEYCRGPVESSAGIW